MLTLKDIKGEPQIKAYIKGADDHLAEMGFTEHGFRHASLVADIARNILTRLDYSQRKTQLAEIAGYLHDIGNVVNRAQHGQASALLAAQILREMQMDYQEIATIMGAIGNHDEEVGEAVNAVAAALILADKSDVHYTRVRNEDHATFDIHDRVNYAAKHSFIEVKSKEELITLSLEIDTEVSTVMEYFEIFLSRMMMSRRAATVLGCNFQLIINEVELL